jgi:hypothetical protein
MAKAERTQLLMGFLHERGLDGQPPQPVAYDCPEPTVLEAQDADDLQEARLVEPGARTLVAVPRATHREGTVVGASQLRLIQRLEPSPFGDLGVPCLSG